ncbi:MAG: RNA methyltransferase [Alphaproteobacteria bacterium]|nr:RNA methyltransferase [Rhodospirillaceae bacterium]MBT6202636.1 RNA methyltransferase [Rhodospirillaceae bacterium]MBT6511055.1 RNA methyltransferase [Rhodospirillaceae bacterium]MBT7615508.1 RNA methyltransferase [Rhodospirillaceae bacterium]MDG2480722.1 RNA methyltransferase [Alphaproteobacteria bacterium]
MNQPAIILVRPQMGENIGSAARAMANFGLNDLRIVAPRDGWPNSAADVMAAGGIGIIKAARIYDTTVDAVADLRHVWATTARSRFMLKPEVTPQRAAETMVALPSEEGIGVLFGPERSGLDNDDVALADTVLQVPTAPDNASINLAQAVLILGYEWFKLQSKRPDHVMPEGKTFPATKEEIEGFFEHLIRELDDCGFLRNQEQRPILVRNIRTMFLRAGLFDQEVRTLRGIISGLTKGRKPLPPKDQR